MHPVLLVALGSACGGVARWGLDAWIGRLAANGAFPWGIFAVNVLGCLLIGIGAAAIERDGLRLLLLTGVLGGFTTFSTFSLQTVALLQDGRVGLAAAYAGGSLAACLLGCWAGWAGMRALSAGS